MDFTQLLNVYMRLGKTEAEQLVGTCPIPATLSLGPETDDDGEQKMMVTTYNVAPHLARFLRQVADEIEHAGADT